MRIADETQISAIRPDLVQAQQKTVVHMPPELGGEEVIRLGPDESGLNQVRQWEG
jgi:hypothetical protein